MTFSYSSTIPAAGNDPADDQPFMQTNFASIASLIAVDHIGFSTGGGGQHNHVTLAQQIADPASLPTAPIVYSRGVTYFGGVNRTEEFIREASGDGSTIIALTNFFNAPITASNGSSFMPGIPVGGAPYTTSAAVMKWGDCGTVAPGGTPVSFASPFPTQCFQVFVTVTQIGSNSTRLVTVDPNTFSKTGFTAYSSGNVNARYFAIGN